MSSRDRAWASAALGLPLLAAAGFLVLYEPYDEEVRSQPSGKASIHRWYAARALLEEMGLPVEVHGQEGTTPPQDPQAEATLVYWCTNAEHCWPSRPDLEVALPSQRRLYLGPTGPLWGAEGALTPEAVFSGVGVDYVESTLPATVLVESPEGDEAREVAWSPKGVFTGSWTQVWKTPEGAALVVEQSLADLPATYVLSDAPFSVQGLREAENARFFVDLLREEDGQLPPRVIFIVSDLSEQKEEVEPPGIGSFLGGRALSAVLGALALTLAWLWSRAPRFGPLLPDPPPARRELMEHIRAAGAFLWSTGERERLLQPVLRAAPPERRAELVRQGVDTAATSDEQTFAQAVAAAQTAERKPR